MTTVGIVGGLGPESTIDYYRRIIQLWRDEDPFSYPSIIIDSLDVQRGLKLVESDHVELIDYLAESIERLSNAGVDFVTMAANTPHIVFDELAPLSPVPLLSIVETCANEAQRRRYKTLGLLGTRFTMEAPFYPAVFARRGMTIVAPNAADREWVHSKYIGELLEGDFRADTRAGFMSLIARLKNDHQIDALILGGTELPLLLGSDTIADTPVLDTTELHVKAIVDRLRADAP
jgi:aspartate racemase